MNAEDKARELVDKYVELLLDVGLYRDDVLNDAKNCADLAVDEILLTVISLDEDGSLAFNWWNTVKDYIRLL
jgi:hypothetical protein